jgi:capsular exopolysaccharide synthesis family protein
MSKIYDALKQKQQEVSASQQSSDPIANALQEDVVQEDVESLPFQPETSQEVFPSYDFGGVPPESKAESRGLECQNIKLASPVDGRLVFKTDPNGLAAEQFRFLRRNVEQKFPNGAVLLVTSPAPNDGKTLTTLNLCSCLADSGRSMLLFEADIRQPALYKFLDDTDSALGVESALAGVASPSQVLHFVKELSLYVSIVKKSPADPSRLIGGAEMKRLVKWAKERFYWVVIDSPPVLPAADVTHLAELADATLLVVRAQSTPRDLTARAIELLGDNLSGVILNEANIETTPYYRYLTKYRRKRAVPNSGNANAGSGGKFSSSAVRSC